MQHFPDNADNLQVARGNAFLIKKDIFKNLMWYVLPDSNKQYPLTIERVRKIKQLNAQGVVPEELEPVEVSTNKAKEENETGFVELVGQISLKSLEKNDRRKKQQQGPHYRGNNRGPQQQGGGQQQSRPGNSGPGNQQQQPPQQRGDRRPDNNNRGPQQRPPFKGPRK